MTKEIYIQLLELYSQDLEVINTELKMEIQYILLQNRVGVNPPLNIDPLRPSWPDLSAITIGWSNYDITETTNEKL
jgi:hypothetical protein